MDELEELLKKQGLRCKKIIQDKKYIDLCDNEDTSSNIVKNNILSLKIQSDLKSHKFYHDILIGFDQITNESNDKNIKNYNNKIYYATLNSNQYIDRKLYKKLQLGQIKPERKLDLHGYHIDDAYNKFINFIKESFYQKERLILVVVGLSNFTEDSIRSNVVKWVEGSDDLKKIIQYFGYASKKHGGDGAFYFYLRINASC